MRSKDLILHVICFSLALTDYFYPSSIKGATFLIWLSRHEVIPNVVGFLPQINHSQRMLGSIILHDILSSCVFPCRWSCTETLPSDNVKTEDCSGPQLLKIFTLGQGKNTSWSDARHVNDFNIHVLALLLWLNNKKAAKWKETKDQSYIILIYPSPCYQNCSKLPKIASVSQFPRNWPNFQIIWHFPSNLPTKKKTHPPWICHPAIKQLNPISSQ